MFRFAALWALQFVGTLLLLSGLYWWLTWPDEHAWQVAASALMALLLLAGAACMERTVFAAEREPPAGLLPRPAFSACAAFALWLAVFVAAELGILSLGEGVESVAVRIAQLAHLPPRLTTGVLERCVCAILWLLLPALLLPLGSLLSRRGFAALHRKALLGALRALGSLRYWSGLCLALAGVYASSRLIDWIPERHTLRSELWSAGLRLGAAYLLAVTAIAFVAWNTGRVVPPADAASAPEKTASASS